MQKSRVVRVLLVIALGALLAWWFVGPRQFDAPVVSTSTQPTHEARPSSDALPVVHSSDAEPAPLPVDALPLPEEDDAATQYAAELRYPSYSQPYRQPLHPADETQYTAVAVEQQDGSQWSLALQKYRFYQPEALVFTLSYPTDLPLAQLKLEVLSQGQERLLAQTSVAATTGTQLWQLSAGIDWPEELVLRVSSGSGHSIRAPFEWVRPVATITQVQQASVQGEDLEIPLQLKTSETGLYQIQGLLMANGAVIARLVETQTLRQGSVRAVLKAHGSVLPTTTQALTVTALRLQRMSPAPDVPPRFGNSAIAEAGIGEFGQSDVSFQPYQPSAEEQQRLQFLRGQ